jgi:hypothetical protein
MPDRRTEHAKQQIRELGQAVRKAAREVDRAYPNTKQGDRAVREFRQQSNRIVQSNRQSRNRSLGAVILPVKSFKSGFLWPHLGVSGDSDGVRDFTHDLFLLKPSRSTLLKLRGIYDANALV